MRELSKTRGEIEQTKGRMQYLERTSATSLIRVQLNQAQLDIRPHRFQASTVDRQRLLMSSGVGITHSTARPSGSLPFHERQTSRLPTFPRTPNLQAPYSPPRLTLHASTRWRSRVAFSGLLRVVVAGTSIHGLVISQIVHTGGRFLCTCLWELSWSEKPMS